MIPGPDYIYQCPHCGNFLARESLISGNTVDAKFYSDGRRIAPMLPRFPNLVKCKKCNNFLWLNKMKEVGTRDRWKSQDSEWQNVSRVAFLGIDDYFGALECGMASDKMDEIYIRGEIWWAYNDRLRKGEKIFISERDQQRWRENCIQLMKLFDDSNEQQRLIIAEINRNLGNFEECENIMSTINDDDLKWVKEKILSECLKRNQWVIQLNDNNLHRK